MPQEDSHLIFFDCDGNSDDLITYLVMRRIPSIRLLGVNILNADCRHEASFEALRRIEKALGLTPLPCGVHPDEVPNPFPELWRDDSIRFNSLRSLREVTKPTERPDYAEDLFVQSLRRADRPVTVICTGPLTVIARTLARRPRLAEKIKELVIMGGAIRVAGNVTHAGTDGTAEWNVYADPESFAAVLQTNVPILLIPLDVTNKIPVNGRLKQAVGELCATSLAARICHEMWSMQEGQDLYLWDVTTALALVRPDCFLFDRIDIAIQLEGESLGRLHEVPSSKGREIECAFSCDAEQIIDFVLKILS